MKKILLFLLLALCSVISGQVKAAGVGPANFEFTPSPATAVADGQSTISVAVLAYHYKCSTPNEYDYQYSTDPNFCAANGFGTPTKEGKNIGVGYTLSAGAGTTVAPSTFETDGTGHGSFTIKSTVAGARTVNIITSIGELYGSGTVTFTSPPAAPAPQTTKNNAAPTPTPTVTPTPTTATPVPTTIATPAIAAIKVNGNQLDTSKPITSNNQNH